VVLQIASGNVERCQENTVWWAVLKKNDGPVIFILMADSEVPTLGALDSEIHPKPYLKSR
jgi:hypothetical protein